MLCWASQAALFENENKWRKKWLSNRDAPGDKVLWKQKLCKAVMYFTGTLRMLFKLVIIIMSL